MQNYTNATAGTSALGNALGLGGASGNAAATAAFQNNPGYQFQMQQGNNAILAKQAATGSLDSGNTLKALSDYNQGLAGTSWQNYVNSLQPYLGAANSAASGIAGVDTGLGQGLNQSYTGQGNAAYGAQTSIGNANANANLAGLNASGNIINAGMGAIGAIGSMFSDERLKEHIEPVGETYDGLGIYRYNYKGDETPRIGLIAQEVEGRYPDAVAEVGGYKAVHYGRATEYAAAINKFRDGGDNDSAPFGRGGFAQDAMRFAA
jgi:hypothetical protein